MFRFGDLFQWERFITPSVIKVFYWLIVVITVLFGLSSLLTGLSMIALSPVAGGIMVVASLAGIFVGIIFARIAAELVLIVFRISEHLSAIRKAGDL